MTYRERAQDIQNRIMNGQLLEAFDHYYHDGVVMVEGDGTVREGKATNRQFEEQWLASVKEIHGGGTTAVTSDEANGKTAVESWIDVTFQDGNRYKMEQTAVQTWEGDKIIHERFYYDTGAH